MSEIKGKGRRNTSFWKSDTPLTSKRVSKMLSNPKSSSDLAVAVRSTRHESHSGKAGKNQRHSFKVD